MQPQSHPDPGELRRRVAAIVRDRESVTYPEVVQQLIADEPLTEEDGAQVVDQLERNGFVYLVPSHAPPEDQEVRLP